MDLEEIYKVTKDAATVWYSGDKELLEKVKSTTLDNFQRKITPKVVMGLLNQIESLSENRNE